MKLIFPSAFFLATTFLLSCEDNSVKPVRPRVILPLRLEQDDYKREFTFDAQNRVTAVKNSSYYPGDVTLETTTDFYYASDGKLDKTVTDTGYRLEYTYAEDKIVRTDEYLNGELSQYHTFSYNIAGKLQEYTTWQEIVEFGGVVPKAKEVYLYDSRGNMSHQYLYFYNSAIQGHELLTSFEFSDYDDHPETEKFFQGHAFAPDAMLSRNNAGKMIIKNRLGNTTIIEQYHYDYDPRGYVTDKTTTITFAYNGNTGSYKTHFFYQER